MKLSTFYTSLVAMLLATTMVFGTVLSDSSGSGSSASAYATADAPNYYVNNSESGWYWEYTTRGGSCSWSFSNYADAYAWAILMSGQSASATGIGQAKVTGPVSNTAYVNASISGTGTEDNQLIKDDPDPDSDSGSGSGCFNAYTGISIEVVALAIASIEEDCYAHAESGASGIVSLTEN
jgi:hypothetical protein